MMLDENVLLRQERDFPRELCLVLTKIKGDLCHRHHEGLCIMHFLTVQCNNKLFVFLQFNLFHKFFLCFLSKTSSFRGFGIKSIMNSGMK